MRVKLFFIIFFLALTTLPCHADADTDIKLEAIGPSKVILDKPFQVSFVINAKGKDFRLPEIVDFDILAGPYSSHSSRTSNTNGKTKTVVSNKTTYTLLAKKTGKFSIPAASIVVKGEKYYSKGLQIEVLPIDESAQTETTNPSSKKNTSNKTNLSEENLFVRTIVSKTKVFEQEAIHVSYRLYSTLNVINFLAKELPDFKGFIKNEIKNEPQLSLDNYKGKNYTTVDLYQVVLFPQHTGIVQIDKANFDVVIRVENPNRTNNYFDNFFDSSTDFTRNLTAPAIRINVDALPKMTKPENFSGAVGNFNINSSISKTEATENEAITLKVEILGSGNMRMIKTPEIKFPDSFEKYEPKTINDFNLSNTGLSGKKTIEYLFIPRHSGDFEIPAFSFVYFDLKTKEYKTIQTERYKIKIAKDEKRKTDAGNIKSYNAEKKHVKQLGQDIRYIYINGLTFNNQKEEIKVGTLLSYLIFLLPLALTLLIFMVLRKKAKDSSDILVVKNRTANKIALKRLKLAKKLLEEGKKELFYDELLKAIWLYLSDKLSIPLATLTRHNVKEELESKQVNNESINHLFELLDSCEFARYAPSSAQEEMSTVFEKSIKTISELEEKIKTK